MAILHLLIGIPGSGKSTYAKVLKEKNNAVIVSSDVVRTKNPHWDEEKIFPEVHRLCAYYLKNNQDVIYDATNYSKEIRRNALITIKKQFDDFEAYAYYFPLDYKLCEKRVKIRNRNPNERYLPIEVIKKYSLMLEEPSILEGFEKIIII